MAIVIRRGAYADFVPSKLQPGEFADVQSGDPNTTDGKALYICLASGNVVRIASSSEIDAIMTDVDLHLATWSGNLAPEYSSSSGYSVGDFAVHENVLYKCQTNIPAGGEAWNSSHWTQTTIMDLVPDIDTTLTVSGDAADAKVVGDEITDLKADLNDIAFKSTNLVTLKNLSTGIVITTTGAETSNTTYNTSDYIPINPNGSYYFKGVIYIAIYKKDKSFRIRSNAISAGCERTFNSTDYYIRLCSNLNPDTWQMNIGNEAQEYMPPDEIYLSEDVSIAAQIDSTLLDGNKAANAKATGDAIRTLNDNVSNIITQSNNLVTLNNLSEGIVIAANGDENPNTSYNTSDFIDVEPSTVYYIKGTPYIATYDNSKNFKTRHSIASSGSVVTTDSATYYLRITSNYNKDTWQINLGSEAQEYMPPDEILLNQKINIDEQLKPIDDRVSALEALSGLGVSFVVPFKPYEPYWYTGETIASHPNSGELSSLYALYDGLVAQYPLYISKNVIGRDASDTYDILCYKLTNGINRAQQKPIFLWVSNIHGNEANSTISTYYMTKELLRGLVSNDDIASNILSTIQVWIIPTLNPWGLEHYLRTNVNNVNLNRNFPADWGYRDPDLPFDDGVHSAVGSGGNKYYYYGGEYPASEPETQALISLVEANKSNIFFAVNKHDAGPFASEGAAVIFTDVFTKDLKVLIGLQKAFETQISIRQPWVREKERWTSVGRVNLTTTSAKTQPTKPWASCGTMDKWFCLEGIHGCLLEIIAYAGEKTVEYDNGETGPLFDNPDHRSDINAINVSVGVNLISTMMCENGFIIDDTTEYTFTEYNTQEDKDYADAHKP